MVSETNIQDKEGTMTFKLGTNIQEGQKIKTQWGWRKVLGVTDEGAKVKEGVVKFGETVFGWKAR
jgi:hypothetical protein